MSKTVEEEVEELTSQGTFDLGAYLSNGGVTLAEKPVIVYTDMAAQLAIDEVLPQIAQKEDSYAGSIAGVPEDDDELNALYALRNEMIQRKWATRLEVTLRTVAPKVLNIFTKKSIRLAKANEWSDEERTEYVSDEFFRHSIKSVEVVAEGQTVTGPLSKAAYQSFMESLPETEVEKVLSVASFLTYKVRMADDKIDAGFPGGSSDMAGEL